MRPPVLFVGFALAFLSACQLRIAVDVAVEESGAGAFELQVAADEELAELLADAGADPLADLDALRAVVPDWTVTLDEGAELAVTFATTFEEPADLAERTDRLHDALDDIDGRLFDDLALVLEDDRLRFTGALGVVPPEVPGATGAGVEFDVDDLRRLLEERGDEFVRYDLRVTLPRPAVEHDADEVEGRSLTWNLPVGELRRVEAVASVGSDRTWWIAGGVAALAAVVSASVIVSLRLRGRRP